MRMWFRLALETGDNEDMRRLLFISASLLMLVSLALASKPTATEVMSRAQLEAKQQKKNIFVMFDASW